MDEFTNVQSTDVFRDSSYCGWESCPLNLKNTKVVLELLRETLKMYREEFHIDGIRWITRQGDRVLGGTCSTSEMSDPDNDRLLQDFWVDIKSFGFITVDSVMGIQISSLIILIVFLPMTIWWMNLSVISLIMLPQWELLELSFYKLLIMLTILKPIISFVLSVFALFL